MRIINFGAGVNSTAVLAMIKLGDLDYGNIEKDYIIVFADTGGENPETYCNIRQIEKEFRIHTVRKEPSLFNYCMEERIIPTRWLRWCTDKWKVRPIHKFLAENNMINQTEVLGFDASEQNRIVRIRQLNQERSFEFPLYSMNMTRDLCKKKIKEAGWKIPPKSGCFFCPFHTVAEWKRLRGQFPELFKKAEELERNALTRFDKLFLHGDTALSKSLHTSETQSLLSVYQGCLCRLD